MKPQCVSIIQHLTSKDIKMYVLNQFETLRMHVALLSILSLSNLIHFFHLLYVTVVHFHQKITEQQILQR